MAAETGSRRTASTATKPPDIAAYFGLPRSSELSRHFRTLAGWPSHRRAAETRNDLVRGAKGRRVSEGGFGVNGCRASWPDVGGISGGEAEEKPLLFPVVRQVLAQPQEPRRRQLDRLATLQDGVKDIGREVR